MNVKTCAQECELNVLYTIRRTFGQMSKCINVYNNMGSTRKVYGNKNGKVLFRWWYVNV